MYLLYFFKIKKKRGIKKSGKRGREGDKKDSDIVGMVC